MGREPRVKWISMGLRKPESSASVSIEIPGEGRTPSGTHCLHSELGKSHVSWRCGMGAVRSSGEVPSQRFS